MALPIWSEKTVIADQVLTTGNVVRSQLDLRTRFGANVMIAIGRSSTTIFNASGVDVLIRRTIGADIAQHVAPVTAFRTAVGTTIPAIVRQQVSGAQSAGQVGVTLTATSTFAANALVCCWGSVDPSVALTNGAAIANLEFARVAKSNLSVMTLDSPTRVAKANNEHIVDQAESFMAWIEGGAMYDVIVDLADDTQGFDVAVRVVAQILESAV